jgi:hypothetical protein
LEGHREGKLRVFVVWEPVLPTDWASPSTFTMKRMADSRVQQYWDKPRVLSRAMGEHDRDSIVWDWVGVYSPEAEWNGSPPKPVFDNGPIVDVLPAFTRALALQD